MEKIRGTKLFSIILMICILCSTICNPSVFAMEENEAVSMNEETEPIPANEETEELSYLTVGIYQDADRTELVTTLNSQGATLEGWEFFSDSNSVADKYLGISLAGLPMDGSQYQIVIEMDSVLYVNQNNDPSLAGATVSFVSNKAITVNTDGKYTPHKYSFSNLTYLLGEGAQSMEFGIPLRFDVNLWNKQDNGCLGNGEDPLLKVYLQKKQEDNSFATLENCSVNLMQATVKGKIPYAASHSTKVVGGSQTATNNMGKDDELRMSFAHFSSSQYSGGHFVKEATVKLNVPSCTVNGTKYFLKYSGIAVKTAGGQSTYTETYDDNTGLLTLEMENFYFKSADTFEIIFSAPEALKAIPGNYVFSGKVLAVMDGINVVTNSKTDMTARGISINLDTNNQAILKTFAAGGAANVMDLDTVQPFGNLAIQNDAANSGSGPLWIELTFDSNETKAVSVTTVNLMCDRDAEYIKIEYTLVDKEGNPAYPDENGKNQIFTTEVRNKHYRPGGKIETSHYITFSRNDLPIEEHKEFYFKTLSYTMGNLPGNSKAYHSGASKAPYSAGTIWGYVNVSEVPAVHPQHTLVLNQYVNETAVPLGLSKTTTTKLDAGTTVSYGLKSPSVSASAVRAGDSVTIKGSVFVVSYPYSSNNCLNDIRLGLILPKGVTINEMSISAKYTGGTLGVKKVSSRDIGGNNILSIIEFEQGNKIGYYNEKLGELANGGSLAFSIQLNSDKTMSTQTISLKDSVFVTGLYRKNGAGGSYSVNAAVDMYDLNENGSVTDAIGCFDSNNTNQSITFQALPAELVITDELSNTDGEKGSQLYMKSFADVLTYNLNIECTDGGSATEFFYIIPVGKTNWDEESTFVSKCQVDLDLTGEASLLTEQGTAMKVLYSTTQVKNYIAAVAVDDWSETLPDGKTWSDVTMIKVVAAEDTLVNGSVNVISLSLKYVGEDLAYEHMAGYQIQWKSRGYYCYELGYNSNSGMRSTKGCTITLSYTPKEPKCFTLTAAKEGKTTIENANVYSFELPEFFLAQEYSVKEITPYNVNLMNLEYDFSKANSAEANENFRIKISVKKSGTDIASTPIAIQKNNDIIGELDGNSAPIFTFEIENADALSDIVTERKVTLTLIGNNGVIVPVEITILREMAAAEPTTSAIVAGEVYSPFEGEAISTEVSQDSAFTAQFVTQYIPFNYKNRTLVFDRALCVDTQLTMIDWTNPKEVGFYHYTICESDGSSISLSKFEVMGSNTEEKYLEPTITDMVTERLLFIVEFPAKGETLYENPNTITLTKEIKSGTDDSTVSTLAFSTVEKRVFSLTTDTQKINMNDSVTLNYTLDCAVVDSRYTGRAMSLVVRPEAGIILPTDAQLQVGGKVIALNSAGEFIIPLRSVQQGNGSVTIEFASELVSKVSLEASLWVAATAEPEKPMMGETVAGPVKIEIQKDTTPSFNVKTMKQRVLKKSDLSEVVTVEIQSLKAETITVEVQKKTGADYATQTTVIESVNGNTTADVGQGVFTVKSKNGNMTFNLSRNSAPGTYRLLFKVTNGSKTTEVPYNFIIIE